MEITLARAIVMAPHHAALLAARQPNSYAMLCQDCRNVVYDTEWSRLSRLSRVGVRLVHSIKADQRSQRVKLVTAAPELAFACIFVFEYLDRDIYNDILETYPEDWEKAWKSLKPQRPIDD